MSSLGQTKLMLFGLTNQQEQDSPVVFGIMMRVEFKRIFMLFFKNFTNSYLSTRTTHSISQVNPMPVTTFLQFPIIFGRRTKDDYQCTNVETPNCYMEEKVIN